MLVGMTVKMTTGFEDPDRVVARQLGGPAGSVRSYWSQRASAATRGVGETVSAMAELSSRWAPTGVRARKGAGDEDEDGDADGEGWASGWAGRVSGQRARGERKSVDGDGQTGREGGKERWKRVTGGPRGFVPRGRRLDARPKCRLSTRTQIRCCVCDWSSAK